MDNCIAANIISFSEVGKIGDCGVSFATIPACAGSWLFIAYL